MKQSPKKIFALLLMLVLAISLLSVPSLAAGESAADAPAKSTSVKSILADVKEEFTEATLIGDYCKMAFDAIDSFKSFHFVILGVLSLILCFFGYRLLRFMLAIIGFFGGFYGGLVLYPSILKLISLPPIVELVVGLICAIGGALVCHFMFRVAIFAGVGFATFTVAAPYVADVPNGSLYRILAAIGVAVVVILLLKVLYIIASGLLGGVLAATQLCSRVAILSKALYANDAIFSKLAPIGIEAVTIAVVIGALIGVFGVIFQFSNTRKRRA